MTSGINTLWDNWLLEQMYISRHYVVQLKQIYFGTNILRNKR